ncbi:hypothetical protein Tco_1140465 [Tanacetum coccineum]
MKVFSLKTKIARQDFSKEKGYKRSMYPNRGGNVLGGWDDTLDYMETEIDKEESRTSFVANKQDEGVSVEEKEIADKEVVLKLLLVRQAMMNVATRENVSVVNYERGSRKVQEEWEAEEEKKKVG